MVTFIRTVAFLGFLLFLTGCDLFPRRDAEANAALTQNILRQLDALEEQGLLDPDTISFVYVHRFGTGFGSSQLLEGRDETTGAYLGAEDMLAFCLANTDDPQPLSIRRCLKRTYAISADLRYAHAGLAYKLPGQSWYIRQSLRASDSGLHFQWFGTLHDFVDIPLIDTRIEILVPTIDLQTKLAQALFQEHVGDVLIDPDYNLVAGPFQDREQMSNQYVLEITAAALRPPETPLTRSHVQAYLRDQGFRPDVILLGGLRSLAKWDTLIPTVDLSDQPYARKYEIGEMITVRSVRTFLTQGGHITQRLEIRD